MSELVIIVELTLLVLFYILVMHTYSKIYHKYKELQNKPEVLTSDDDINIVEVPNLSKKN